MSSSEFVDLLTQLAVMLFAGVALGFVARKLKQPAVVGEMVAGLVIGVTFLGSVAPDVYDWIFNSGDLVTSTRGDIIKLGMIFFLYVAGSEIDLTDVKTLGRQSLIIGVIGSALPIALGIGLVYVTPMSMWGESMGVSRFAFAAFIGMNIANSANPVLARILIDLGLMKSRVATMMMTATIVDDLLNWTLYAIILGSIDTGESGSDRGLALDLLLVALLFVGVLGVVRWVVPHIVEFARKHLAWPSGYVAVAAIVLLIVSAVSEAIGVQAFLGAFLAGVAFSSVANGPGAAGQKSIVNFSVGFFAPLFFVGMALRTDFVEAFDPVLVITVILFALAAKLFSVMVGVRAAGMPLGRETWAMAWGLNARGATGIILAATGLQVGLINEEVFVALVVMAIVTSILAGPMMVRALGPLREKMAREVMAEEEASAPGMEYAARVLERDLTEAERNNMRSSVYYRVLVAIDDPSTARPLVEVAAELAASQKPAEVVLVSYKKQTELESKIISRALDEIASDLGSVRELEQLVQTFGVTPVSVSMRSTDLATDIAATAVDQGAHALVIGDSRDDPEWVQIVDRLIAESPIDIYVVVAPKPRLGAAERVGGPVVEASGGLPGEAGLEAAVRFALSIGVGPVIVGTDPESNASAGYRAALEELARLGRPGRIEPHTLDTIDGAAVTDDARLVVRPFSAPEGLEPLERARPDAERFGCPVVLVAPDPNRPERVSLLELFAGAKAPTEQPDMPTP